LEAGDLDAVGRWLERNGADGLTLERRPTQNIHDAYLDTADWRVFRAGFALRIRGKNGEAEACLKGLRSARSDVADRRELTEPLTSSALEALAEATGPVASRVSDVIGEKSLHTLFEVRTSRQRFAVRRPGREEQLGEVALDDSRVLFGNGGHEASLRRVEIEAFGEQARGSLEPLVGLLRSECGLQPGAPSKFAVGLRAAGLAPPALRPSAVAPILPSIRIGQAVRQALAGQLADWRAHEPGARLGEDPEELHALRVAGRRMDAVLALFAADLPAGLGPARRKLKTLLGTLGAVRDLDILLAEIGSLGHRLAESQRAALEPLIRYGEAERARARARMLRALNARSSQKWFEQLASVAAQSSSPASPSRGTAPATAVLPELIRTRYRKLRKRARRLRPSSPMSDYHALRVRTKKLRYALETCASLYGRPAEEMLEALRRLQGRLGDQQDACVITRELMRLATRPPAGIPAETLFLMGRLAERHSLEAVRMGRRIGKGWRKLEGRRWKALVSRLGELEPSPAPAGKRASRGPQPPQGINPDEA
jgi:CHAD domain-containing protein